jgi:hypothetical protein
VAQQQQQANQANQAKLQMAISIGSTLLSAMFGRSSISAGAIGKAATSVRGASRAMKDSQDIGQSQESVAGVQQQLDALEAALQSEIKGLDLKFNPLAESLAQVNLRPKKADINVIACGLAWVPCWQVDGEATQLAWSPSR